jgi:hypothetical protein
MESLTRKLLKVPKAEVDALRKKQEASKKPRTRRNT